MQLYLGSLEGYFMVLASKTAYQGVLILLACGGLSACAVTTEDAWLTPDSIPPTEVDLGATRESSRNLLDSSLIDDAIRFNRGLVKIGPSGCPGLTFKKHWVITMAGCVDFANPRGNVVSLPLADGRLMLRSAVVAQRIPEEWRSEDPAMLVLDSAIPAGDIDNNWPDHPVPTFVAPAIGKWLTCYGNGPTLVDADTGDILLSRWGALAMSLHQVDNAWAFLSEANTFVPTPQDRGGTCFDSNNRLAGMITGYGQRTCDTSGTFELCARTTRDIETAEMLGFRDWQKRYFASAPFRKQVHFTPITPTAPAVDFRGLPIGAATEDGAFTNAGAYVAMKGFVSVSESQYIGSLFTLPVGVRPEAKVTVPYTSGLQLDIESTGKVYLRGEILQPGIVNLSTIQFVRAETATTAIQPTNNWRTAEGRRAPAFAIQNGFVFLKGAISTNQANTSQDIFRLPANARPDATVYLPVVTNWGGKSRIIIKPDGYVRVSGDVSKAKAWMSLEGVSFALSSAGFQAISIKAGSGWSDTIYGTRRLAVKQEGGFLRFQGAIMGGTTKTVGSLPTDMFPMNELSSRLQLDGCNGAQLSAAVQDETRELALGSLDSCFASFEGASYPL